MLRAAQRGERVIITKSGKPVADLVRHGQEGPDPRDVIAEMRRMREGVGLGGLVLKELITVGASPASDLFSSSDTN